MSGRHEAPSGLVANSAFSSINGAQTHLGSQPFRLCAPPGPSIDPGINDKLSNLPALLAQSHFKL